jgi:hypothetical protein
MITDFKFFTESRALITWLVIDLLFMLDQYDNLGKVTNALATVTFLHGWYVMHFFWFEENVLSMIDFTSGMELISSL